jgi:hypothetical protein
MYDVAGLDRLYNGIDTETFKVKSYLQILPPGLKFPQ